MCKCAVILHIQVNPMIYSYNMNSGQVPGTIDLARDINQVAKTTGEEPSSEPSQMDLRAQNSVVKRRVRLPWFHMVS